MRGKTEVVRVIDYVGSLVKDVENPEKRKISTDKHDKGVVRCFECGKRVKLPKRRESKRWELLEDSEQGAERKSTPVIICEECYELEGEYKRARDEHAKKAYLKDVKAHVSECDRTKACPFCGGEASLYIVPVSERMKIYYMKCDICGARTCDGMDETTVRAAWNVRKGE